MNRLFSLLLFVGMLAAPTFAQYKPDPTISLDQLETELSKLEAKDLPAVGDYFWGLIDAKEREIIRLGETKKKAEGAASDDLMNEITTKIEERDAIKQRLLVVQRVLRNNEGAEKADALDKKIKALSVSGDYASLTNPNDVYKVIKNWVLSPTGGILWGMNIVFFIVILILARILSNIGAKVVEKSIHASRMKASNLLKDFFVNSTRKTIFFGGVIIALGKIGIDIAPLLTGIGVVGFVVGFALQGTLSNFACGVMILLYRPYDVGDVVGAAGATGKVTEMSLVSTTLTTPDNQIVVIPNSSIWGGVITNITGNPTRRVDMTFGIGYGDDIALAIKILSDIVNSHEKVLQDPAPVIQLHELADSSVNFVVRPWSKTSDYWAVYWDVTRQVKERFDAEGVSIPFPQQDVHHHGLEGLMKAN